MKKILIILAAALLTLSSCGVGAVSVASGKADEAFVSFTAATAQPIVVSVDGVEYTTKSVKVQDWNNVKSLKAVANNVVNVKPGTHEVIVRDQKGNQLYQGKIFVSAQEHKMIKL